MAHWLRLCSLTAKGWGSIPSWGPKLCGVAQKKKKKKVSYSDYYCYYFIPLPSFLSLQKKKKQKPMATFFMEYFKSVTLIGILGIALYLTGRPQAKSLPLRAPVPLSKPLTK